MAEDAPAEEPAAEPTAIEVEPTDAERAKGSLQKKRRKAAAAAAEKRLRESVCTGAPYFALTADGLLVNLQHKRKGSDGEIAKELDMMQRIYIPTSTTELQNELIDALHTEAGHPKSLRTYQLMLQRVYWPGMFASVHERSVSSMQPDQPKHHCWVTRWPPDVERSLHWMSFISQRRQEEMNMR